LSTPRDNFHRRGGDHGNYNHRTRNYNYNYNHARNNCNGGGQRNYNNIRRSLVRYQLCGKNGHEVLNCWERFNHGYHGKENVSSSCPPHMSELMQNRLPSP
jgi:hypothetical protein